MNAVVQASPAEAGAVTLAEAPVHSLLNCVALAMRDPATDVAKLEALRRMQCEIVAEDARLRFVQAMRAAQAEMQPILRSATNPETRSKYAPLEDIDPLIRPIYTRHGFAMEFNSEPIEGGVRLICEVSHDAGHVKLRHLEAALDTAGPQGKPNKTPVQGLVSSTTYLRRALTAMVWNLVFTNSDNDGNRVRDGGARETGEVSGRTQVAELYALLAECSADPKAVAANERAFLAKMNLGELRSLADAPAREFPRLKNALLTKRAIIAQRAKNTTQHTGVAA